MDQGSTEPATDDQMAYAGHDAHGNRVHWAAARPPGPNQKFFWGIVNMTSPSPPRSPYLPSSACLPLPPFVLLGVPRSHGRPSGGMTCA